MHSLKLLFRRLHAALPDNVGRQIDITSVGLQDTLHNWRMPAYYVRSALPEDKGEGTVLYIGDRPQYKAWTHKLFGHAVEPISLGQFSLFQLLRGQNPALTADLTLCPLNPWTMPLFARGGWHIIPWHVLSRIDLAKPINVLTSSRDAKNELRVIRKLDYHFQELHSEEAFKEFYQEMLRPTVMRRHNESGFLSSMESLRQVYAKGFLLAAYLGTEWVGANLVFNDEHGTLLSANVGWRDGNDELMKKRIVSALLHELIKRASDQGFHTLDLGSSNPFANDGPLNYKLKWGANIELPKIEYKQRHLQGARAFIAARFNLASQSARSMLNNMPLFEMYEGALRVIGWSSAIPPTFQQQIDDGMPWVDLAATDNAESSA